MNNLDWEANNDINDLSIRSSYSIEQLKAMRLVAQMKEAADKSGSGFVGGFISPTGERFMMSNVASDDVQTKMINEHLDGMQKQRQEDLRILKLLEEFEG